MESKIILCLAKSVDGYIARLDNKIDFLEGMKPGDAKLFNKFISNSDTVIMGSTSYDQMLDLGGHPFPDMFTYVLTSQEYADEDNILFTDMEIEDLAKAAKEKSKSNVWLFGGAKVIQQFVDRNLVDEFIITTTPTIIGTGVPLFLFSEADIKLELVDSEVVGDFVTVHYKKV